ncbi:MAG: hypothetical protein KC897_11980, partial [Candidatus Omnitrophica bacterium]|nr:hypothetical protein [Candidatus Omnitrophota bacterium]
MQDHPFFNDPDPGEFTVAVLLLAFILVLGAYGISRHYQKNTEAPPAPQQEQNRLTKEAARVISERAMLDGELTHVSEQSDETIAVFA